MSGLGARIIQRGARQVLVRHLGLRAPAGAPAAARRSVAGFVEAVVAPAYAEGDLPGYLERARLTRPDVLGDLEVPALIVHSEDDPLVPGVHAERAREAAGDNPHVGVLELPFGGHIGLPYAAPGGTQALLATWFGRLRDG